MNKNKGKVCIAMSGGVDSAVAAVLLKNQGFECIGIFMRFWSDPKLNKEITNKCCSLESFESARRVAHKLGFPIYTLNFKQPFKKLIVDDFIRQYQAGLTPNPCIRCNKFIKFDLLLKKAKMLGCNYLATGHYVKIETRDKKQETREEAKKNLSPVACHLSLAQAKDKNKDQSYFLYTLKQNQLKHLLFPLGDYTKVQVRELAKKLKLPVHNRPDSQEICFIAEKKPVEFLKRYLPLKPGLIKTVDGKIIGQHEGLPLYTLGQRKGIKIGGIGPFYVVRMDYKTNTLIVSNKRDDKKLYTKKFIVKEVSWISEKPSWPLNCQVKIRYQAPGIKCQVVKNRVILSQPQWAVTPGQSAVFYSGQRVLGGGAIDRLKKFEK